MKRTFLTAAFSVLASFLYAQDKPVFIFDQFINARIHFKNRSVTVAPMNYDAANDRMYFRQGEDLMELTNQALIDSIAWAGRRCFVPQTTGYLEKVSLENGIAYICWRIRNVNVGSKGAFGTITQGKVESISIRSMGVFSATDAEGHNADVYQLKNNNEYFLPIGGELKKITTVKHVQKLFPQHAAAIKEYAGKEKINMKEPLDVLQLLNYCLGCKE